MRTRPEAMAFARYLSRSLESAASPGVRWKTSGMPDERLWLCDVGEPRRLAR